MFSLKFVNMNECFKSKTLKRKYLIKIKILLNVYYWKYMLFNKINLYIYCGLAFINNIFLYNFNHFV